jgi:putative transposase
VTWDITKLPGPRRGIHYSLYVILDIFSRYVVAWTVAPTEDAILAKDFIEQACVKQNIRPGQLTIHADRGSSMKSRPVVYLLADLEVTRSHSRPRVSDDNPFSESQFKTLKYRPEFPERFGSIEDSRVFCRRFFDWYNREHRHSGIAMLTPHDVHYGRAKNVLAFRQQTLTQAYVAHPERFPGGPPAPSRLHEVVWINQPISPSSVGSAVGTEEHPADR